MAKSPKFTNYDEKIGGKSSSTAVRSDSKYGKLAAEEKSKTVKNLDQKLPKNSVQKKANEDVGNMSAGIAVGVRAKMNAEKSKKK